MALKMFTRNKTAASPKQQQRPKRRSVPEQPEASPTPPPNYEAAPRETLETDPARRLLQQGRHVLVMGDAAKWRQHPGGASAVEQAERELELHMALVPAGTVSLSTTLSAQPGDPEEEIEVAPYLLDVHTVTCARYQRFVDDGGYDCLDLWPEEIWPHLIEFKDSAEEAAPRLWQGGRHESRLSDHPVVGISWYEAQAFAIWCGKRLPSEAEWQMAASWHINSSADLMRRFPWGDAMDNTRCNVWSSRQGGTVSVASYPKGAAPNQVLQLSGNVWEWVDTEYMITDENSRAIIGEMPMQVIRGGAFDTYFETQASSHFRTGQIALARTHNTGFRCAIDLKEATWINGG